MVALVQFTVGRKHPLHNKQVYANIRPGVGYDHQCVFGETINEVYYPTDPKGLLVYNGNKFAGYLPKPGYSERYSGWVEKLYSEKLQKWVSARQYSEYFNQERYQAFLNNECNYGPLS